MYIEYIKLVNHIPFKDEVIELDFKESDKIVMIKGKTGSGKSFLVSCISPLSSSSRYTKSYSIYPNKAGYKEVIYNLVDKKVKIRHEYTPNNKGGHSCKSYIALYENGDWRELNDSGHNQEFESLVKKYLNYERKTADFSSLNVKSSGFIQSTSDNRNKTLFSLVETDTIKSFKDNLTGNISDNNSRLRLFKESRDNIIQSRNIEEDKSSIVQYNKTISDNQKELQISKESLHNEIEKLAVFKTESSKYSMSDLDTCSKFIEDCTKIIETHSLKSVSDLINYEKNKVNTINELTNSIEKRRLSISVLQNSINKIKSINTLASKITSTEKEIESIRHSIMDRFNINNLGSINSMNSVIGDIRKSTNVIRTLDIYNVSSIEELRTFRTNLKTETDNLIKKNAAYEQAIEFKKLIKSKTDTQCQSCGSDIAVLKQIYDSINIDIDLDELNHMIEDNTNRIRALDANIQTLSSSIKQLNELNILSDSFISKTHLDSLDNYIKYILFSDNDVLESIIDSKDYGINQLHTLETELKNFTMEYNILSKDSEGDLLSKEQEMEEEVNLLETDKNRMESILLEGETKDASDCDKFSNYTIEEFKELYNKSKNIDRSIKEFEQKINSLKYTISKLEADNTTFRNDISNLEKIIEEYNKMSDYVKQYSEEKKYLDLTKQILFQDIPTILLDDNIHYIEESVNMILNQCGIDMTVAFKHNENKTGIEIPVYIGNKIIPDATQLSSGETSLISVLINTTLLSLLGYRVLVVDELDAHLDTEIRVALGRILSSLCSILNIDQVFCISHNINIDSSTVLITVGNVDTLEVDYNDKRLYKIE